MTHSSESRFGPDASGSGDVSFVLFLAIALVTLLAFEVLVLLPAAVLAAKW